MLKLTIETNNDAFKYNAYTYNECDELASILRKIADKIEGCRLSDYPQLIVRDINGNNCGVLTLTED